MLDAEQRHQRQDAALAVIVGSHHYGDILDRGNDKECPRDQRQHADRDFGRCSAAPIERRF